MGQRRGGGTLNLAGLISVTAGSLDLGGKTVTGVTTFSVTTGGSIDFGSSSTTVSGAVTRVTAESGTGKGRWTSSCSA